MVVFPDAGSRSIAVALHRAFNEIEKALSLPRKDDRDVRRTLSWHITNLSDAVRDLTLDFSITRFRPSDIQTIRNLLQGVIRATLVIQPDTQLFSLARLDSSDATLAENGLRKTPSTLAVIISSRLAEPTSALLKSSMSTLATCDAVLMDLSSYRRYLGPSMDVSTDLPSALQVLSSTIEMFDSADETLLRDPRLPRAYSDHPEVVQLLLFVHPIRLVAGRILALAQKVSQMKSSKWALHRPSYPFVKALSRTNAQVRHDRGGLTAGFYFRTKRQMERTLNDLQSRTFDSVVPPHARKDEKPNADGNINESSLNPYWDLNFQHEYRATAILTVVKIGGNFQDLLTRVVAALIGAVWGGFAYAAANGNPYVVAVFAAILMIPMLYRYTQSSHPRSGIVGCISFTVVSLSAYYEKAEGNIVHFTWPRACAFMVGIVAAIVINWIIWPFVARHELRKSLSSMMQHLSVLYRSVVAKYIYYLESEAPTSRDVERSEMLEGRLREAFIRIRQLLALTKHEIRLRAPFNPKCYELLIEGCEGFFEDLVQVRQSSLYFQPRMHRVSGLEGQIMNQALLPYRRDAVASILMDMYILAGALKTTQPVPRYMPSAALARKRLLDRMAELEEAQDEETPLGLQKTLTKGRRWANVYQYAFNVALTDIVERLEDLQQSTKLIVGEKGFDLPDLPTHLNDACGEAHQPQAMFPLSRGSHCPCIIKGIFYSFITLYEALPAATRTREMAPKTSTVEMLNLEGAKIVAQASEEKARAMNLGINIAIVDASTHLLHFIRTPGAKTTSINIAIDKAFTAAGHRAPTHMYMENDAFRPGGPAEGIGRTNGGRFTTIGGGVPILNAKGYVIGAVGASSGTPAQDREVVEAGVEALQESLKSEASLKAKL
ncbi:putative brefeldin a-sensitivity protein 4 [Phaeomoniella chlamydospora]|uniref:Putative brefeldin a-sensitivity protein 4 n=1 Tax=Phaeomoniella chlamydospora TaxID=158046 RepID=A0A0G2E3H3_PHACM|nr:putative brefeldin a-sensitivity protein 4 [Phaeomoniella chlamydospora]